uniref:Uncharacterized protein n=1 Tax=Rhizophora mucronata TaxID=61149 RepID=A0A2P2QHU9_RHIMU
MKMRLLDKSPIQSFVSPERTKGMCVLIWLV